MNKVEHNTGKCPDCGKKLICPTIRGANGGQTTYTKYGREHMRSLSKKRWAPHNAAKKVAEEQAKL